MGNFMKEELKIVIDDTGKVVLHICGLAGQSCYVKAQEIADIVGKIVEQIPVPDHYGPQPKVFITDDDRIRTHRKE